VLALGLAKLNLGTQRMKIGNRLRTLMRKGQEIVWPALT
jgi:hypothetical protein